MAKPAAAKIVELDGQSRGRLVPLQASVHGTEGPAGTTSVTGSHEMGGPILPCTAGTRRLNTLQIERREVARPVQGILGVSGSGPQARQDPDGGRQGRVAIRGMGGRRQGDGAQTRSNQNQTGARLRQAVIRPEEHALGDLVPGLLQLGDEAAEQTSLTEVAQARHVFHGCHVRSRVRNQTTEIIQQAPLARTRFAAVGRKGLARRAAHENPAGSRREEVLEGFGLQPGYVGAQKRRGVVRLVGVAAGRINIKAGREREPLLTEAMRQAAGSTEEIDDRGVG